MIYCIAKTSSASPRPGRWSMVTGRTSLPQQTGSACPAGSPSGLARSLRKDGRSLFFLRDLLVKPLDINLLRGGVLGVPVRPHPLDATAPEIAHDFDVGQV